MLLSAFLAGVITTIGAFIDLSPPSALPLVLTDTQAMFVPSEDAPGEDRVLWRVEMLFEVKSACQTVVVDRRFAPEAGIVRHQIPGLSYKASETATLHIAQEYEVTHADHGNLIVEVSAFACDNGFEGPIPATTVPYDFRGRAP